VIGVQTTSVVRKHRAIDGRFKRAAQLVQLGFCVEQKSHYRLGIEFIRAEAKHKNGALGSDWLKLAYAVLREPGKSMCKRSTRLCPPCPLDATYANFGCELVRALRPLLFKRGIGIDRGESIVQ